MVQQQAQPARELPLLFIENLEYVYKPNFSGAKERYNAEGKRYFNAKIPDKAMAEALARDGWNIKWTKPGPNHPNPEEHIPDPFVVVSLGFDYRPPTIIMIRDGKGTPVVEETVSLLDSVEFSNIDVSIRAVYWQNDSGSGYKAWLKAFYGTVVMDDLDRKYAHLTSAPAIVSSESEDNSDDPPFEIDD